MSGPHESASVPLPAAVAVEEQGAPVARPRPWVDRFAAASRPLQTALAAWDSFDLAAIMTLLLLLLYAGDYWYLKIPITILCIAGILHQPARRSLEFWITATAILVVGNGVNWYLIDNHKYLITYWCLALACCARLPDRERALRLNARLLIGLAFLFATFWKISSPDYADTSFFHHALMMDPRFSVVARFVGGLSPEMISYNTKAVRTLLTYDSQLASVALHDGPRMAALARFMTIWTIAIEGSIAVVFLWPEGRGPSRWRDLPMLLFLVSTYSIAPVIGFGWVLAIMGSTQAVERPRFVRPAYLVTFFVLQVYRVPWRHFFNA
jgi:hypothetical protein